MELEIYSKINILTAIKKPPAKYPDPLISCVIIIGIRKILKLYSIFLLKHAKVIKNNNKNPKMPNSDNNLTKLFEASLLFKVTITGLIYGISYILSK